MHTRIKYLVSLSALVLLASGCSFYPPNTNQTNSSATTRTPSNIYTSGRGFTITLPPSWTNYAVHEEFGTDNTTIIWFALPLSGPYHNPQVQANGNNYVDVWSILSTPTSTWKKDACNKKDLCYQGPELGRNDVYVFEQSGISPEWYGDCSGDTLRKKEPNFCAALTDLANTLGSLRFQVQEPQVDLK
jgi:hypothetical protein